MILVRIDNRLIHGQIIETWLPYTGAKHVVVANDELANDMLQQEIMSLAIPGTVQSAFVRIANLKETMEQLCPASCNGVVVLFSSCADAKNAFEAGFDFDELNIGNVHYTPGKRQVSPSVALSDEDEGCLKHLEHNGVRLDFRCVPNDPVQVSF